LRYASDVTDAEWTLIEPLLPPPSSLGASTRNRSAIGRERDPLHGFDRLPMAAIAKGVSALLHRAGLFLRLVARRRIRERQSRLGHGGAREKAGREASPAAGVIDSQSAKITESGGPRGFDAGKKIKGRKRHIVTDTQGNLVGLVVHEACSLYPWLRHIFADGGYAGGKLRAALKGKGSWTLQIIKRSDAAKGFEVLPRRWVVERTFAWLGRCRRLTRDFEATVASAVTWVLVAHIRILMRRIARA
jgi:transposase